MGSPGANAEEFSHTFTPIADTSLIQIEPDRNHGGAPFFNAGTTRTGWRNRALIRFDLTEILPAGAIITSADLVLEPVRRPIIGAVSSSFALHRVLRAWAEGDKIFEGTLDEPISPGLGLPASPNEATWNDRFAFNGGWSAPGGMAGVDFSGLISATAGSDGSPVVFSSTPELVADLQHWANQPAANFGWLLMSQSEEVWGTARGLASRESEFPPQLVVTFTVVPEPGSLVLWCLGLGVAAVWSRRKSR